MKPQQLAYNYVINAHDYDGQGEGSSSPVNISLSMTTLPPPQTVQASKAHSRMSLTGTSLSKERSLPMPPRS